MISNKLKIILLVLHTGVSTRNILHDNDQSWDQKPTIVDQNFGLPISSLNHNPEFHNDHNKNFHIHRGFDKNNKNHDYHMRNNGEDEEQAFLRRKEFHENKSHNNAHRRLETGFSNRQTTENNNNSNTKRIITNLDKRERNTYVEGKFNNSMVVNGSIYKPQPYYTNINQDKIVNTEEKNKTRDHNMIMNEIILTETMSKNLSYINRDNINLNNNTKINYFNTNIQVNTSKNIVKSNRRVNLTNAGTLLDQDRKVDLSIDKIRNVFKTYDDILKTETKSTTENEMFPKTTTLKKDVPAITGDGDRWIWDDGVTLKTTATVQTTAVTQLTDISIEDRDAFNGDGCPNGKARLGTQCVDIE